MTTAQQTSLLPDSADDADSAADAEDSGAQARQKAVAPAPKPKPISAAAPISDEPSYRVLARKYRPVNFDQLIGQEAMVRTLSHAFARNRMAHAIMLTGMRGVGKTTTARIIARAVNYIDENGEARPGVDMDHISDQCRDILESRHVDVIEMDAASRTGIADIREIIDSVAYRPVMARKKIYIIDEVHMLSTAAFNGLLKTLEEPPDHVMFIFATTEIRKVPVTVLSRCQRFDLRRLTLDETLILLKRVLAEEKLEAEDAALLLLARAAEGAARDALSLLDQAIAHGDGKITESSTQDMLGLAGRAEILDLFDHIAQAAPLAALEDLRKRYDHGADPLLVLADLADVTHFLTRRKLAGETAEDYKLASADRERAGQMAESISLESLTLIWQMLLKGLEETRFAPNPMAAAEMVIIRISHAQTLPSPTQLAEKLSQKAIIPEGAAAKESTSAKESTFERSAPFVQAVMDHFPGAEIIDPSVKR